MTTERSIGAYTVLLLAHHGVIPRNKVSTAFAHLGVSDPERHEAWKRFDEHNPRPLSSSGLKPETAVVKFEPERQSPDVPVNQRKGAGKQRFKNRRVRDGQNQRRCASCRKWKAATPEYFPWKDPVNQRFKSYCRPCDLRRQRKFYLSTAKNEALEGAGVAFTVSARDDVVGLSCAKCGSAIVVGDDVTGSTTLTHESCG